MPCTCAVVLRRACQYRLECRDDSCVELTLNGLRQTRRATRLGIASRYGRSEVIALYASATAMIRASKRDLFALKPIGISVSVDSLVMMADDRGDLGVVINVPENALADDGVLLHLSPLLEG